MLPFLSFLFFSLFNEIKDSSGRESKSARFWWSTSLNEILSCKQKKSIIVSSIYRIRVPFCQFNDLTCPRLAFVHRQSCPAIDIIILHTHASLRALFSFFLRISISFLCFIIASCHSSFTSIHRSYFFFPSSLFNLFLVVCFVRVRVIRLLAARMIRRVPPWDRCVVMFSNPKPVFIDHPSRKI